MMTAGDERGRTQAGNNNAFCHDDELTWVRWRDDPEWAHLHDLTRTLLALRAAHPVLRQRSFFAGKATDATGGGKDITWLTPSGDEMRQADWLDSSATTLGVFLAGDQLRTVDRRGVRRRDTSYLLWLHAGSEPVEVTLPEAWADHYVEVVRTDVALSAEPWKPGSSVLLLDHTVALFEAVATSVS